jgi:hypothetical protein
MGMFTYVLDRVSIDVQPATYFGPPHIAMLTQRDYLYSLIPSRFQVSLASCWFSAGALQLHDRSTVVVVYCGSVRLIVGDALPAGKQPPKHGQNGKDP